MKCCLCLADPLFRWSRQREQQKIRNRRHYLKVKADPELHARRRRANKEAQKKFHAKRNQPQAEQGGPLPFCVDRQHDKSDEEPDDS